MDNDLAAESAYKNEEMKQHFLKDWIKLGKQATLVEKLEKELRDIQDQKKANKFKEIAIGDLSDDGVGL